MVRKLMSCIREYKKATILTPIFVSLEVIIECIIPLITAELINNIKAGCQMNVIVKHGLVLFLLAVLSLTFGVLSGHYCAIASCGFAKNLRHDMYHHVQDFSFSNIDKFS